MASSPVFIPPDALIKRLSFATFFIILTSSNDAPRYEKPVEVLIKSAPDCKTISVIFSISSFVKSAVSTITFNVFDPHSSLIALISFKTYSYSLFLNLPILITISISSAPCEIAILVS